MLFAENLHSGDMTELAAPPSQSEQIPLLALSSLKGVGYWTLFRLKKDGLSLQEILDRREGAEVAEILRKRGAKIAETSEDWPSTAARAIERAHKLQEDLEADGIRVVMKGDPNFPPRLLDLDDTPQWLFVRGSVKVLAEPSIAAVGTRKPTEDGEWLSRYIGMNLRDWNAPTVSGLAAGMDQLIHQYSIRMGVPTIAILGTGIRTEYPKGSWRLADEIVGRGGAVVTEYLINETYSGENFVRRNRLQAALSKVLIPVEWSQKSGTAHTVSYAGRLKRPIAGLRLPDWPVDRVGFPPSFGGARVFCVPRDQQAFFRFVEDGLRASSAGPSDQLSLL